MLRAADVELGVLHSLLLEVVAGELAAVDRDHGAGDIARGRRAEEEREALQLVRLGDAAERHLRREGRLDLGQVHPAAGDVRLERTGRDRVDEDPVPRELDRGVADEVVHGRLRGGVGVADGRLGLDAADRARDDDAAVAARSSSGATAARISTATLVRLVSSTRCQFARSRFSSRPDSMNANPGPAEMPAFAKTASRRPVSCAVSSTSRAAPSRSATSSRRVRMPSRRARPSGSMSTAVTVAPASRKTSAIASPSPLAAPVTMTLCPRTLEELSRRRHPRAPGRRAA